MMAGSLLPCCSCSGEEELLLMASGKKQNVSADH
jgi:hypothetical protein